VPIAFAQPFTRLDEPGGDAMKKSQKALLLLLTPLYVVAMSALAAPPAPAPLCTAQTTAGYWGYTCEGEVAPFGPVRLLGTCTSSKSAYWDCTGTLKTAEAALDQTLQGQAYNEANCTGKIDYTAAFPPYPPGPGNILSINYVILDHGDTIQGLPTNAGYVVSCSLKRISRPAD
jgi:hypothetical protein